MSRHFKGSFWLVIPAFLLAIFAGESFSPEAVAGLVPGQTPGSLQIIGKDGAIAGVCPLSHTHVRGAVSGFIARVTVTQVFENSAEKNIEAVYTFPLPEDAAVDDMTIQIGDRTVRGVIKNAKKRASRKTKSPAAPHCRSAAAKYFPQSLANIAGEQVTVITSYLQTLQYEDGSYMFISNGGRAALYSGLTDRKQAGGWAQDTEVPDASKITPPVACRGMARDTTYRWSWRSMPECDPVCKSTRMMSMINTWREYATVKCAMKRKSQQGFY
jgi:Ca-activated chloride channel family protein